MKPRLLGALLSAILLVLSFPLTLLPLPSWLLGLLPYETVADPALGSFSIPGLPSHLGYLQFPWLAYVALVPLLMAIRASRRSREAFMLGSICGFIWLLVSLLWLISFGFVPVLLLAIYFSLPVGLFAWLAWHLMYLPATSKLEVVRLVWGLPLLWTALEYLRSFGMWAFPWNLLGYTQAAYPVLAQSADIGGVYLVTFLVVLVNAVALTLLSTAGTIGLRAAHVALAVVLLSGATAYGWWRVDHPGAAKRKKPLTFALVQGGVSSLEEWDDTRYKESLDAYVKPTRELLGKPDQFASSAVFTPPSLTTVSNLQPAKASQHQPAPKAPPKRLPPGDVLIVWPEGSILKPGGFDLEQGADDIPFEIRELVQGNQEHALLWGVLGYRPPPPPPPLPPLQTKSRSKPQKPTSVKPAPGKSPGRNARSAPTVALSTPDPTVVRPVPAATPNAPQPTLSKPKRDRKRQPRIALPVKPKPKSPAQLERERQQRLVNGSILTTRTGSTWPYSKVRLVPYGEVVPFRGVISFLRFPWNFGGRDLNAGKDLKPFDWRGHKIGPLICFDNVFNFIPLAEARAGAEYLVLMTNNSWYPMRSGIRQHADIDVLRAIETRRPLLRCSTTGWSQLVDRSGRIVQSTEQKVGEPDTLVVATAPGSGRTVYMLVGDLFARICLLLALLITVPPLVIGRSEGFL